MGSLRISRRRRMLGICEDALLLGYGGQSDTAKVLL